MVVVGDEPVELTLAGDAVEGFEAIDLNSFAAFELIALNQRYAVRSVDSECCC